MIVIAKLKTADLAVCLAVLVNSGWIATDTLAQNNTAATPSPAAAIQTTTTAPAIDLSTPERTLSAFSQALKSGDNDKVYACLNLDRNAPPTLMSASLMWNLAANQKARASRKVFGEAAADLRNGVPADAVIDVLLATGPKTQITGDTAAMLFTFPPQIVALLPADVSAAMKKWEGKPFRFLKQGSQWKLDVDRTAHVDMTLPGAPEMAPAERAKVNLALILGLAKIEEEAATKIEAGEFKTVAEAQEFHETRFLQMTRVYRVGGFYFDVLPADIK